MTTSLREYLWRNRWRFTAQEFAVRLKINPTHLSKIANGAMMPSIQLAKKIEIETNAEVKWNEIMDFCYTTAEAKSERSK